MLGNKFRVRLEIPGMKQNHCPIPMGGYGPMVKESKYSRDRDRAVAGRN